VLSRLVQSSPRIRSSLALVVVMLLPAAHALDHYNRATMLAAVCLNVGAAWLRYASVVWGSYSTALLSSAMLGIATSVVMPSFALIPQRWFPPNQRAFATSVNVQSNYLGWGLGTLIPLLVSSPHTMRSFMLAQAAFATLTLPLTLALYRAAPPPLVRPHRTTPPTIRPTDPPLLSLSPLELLSSPSTIDPPHTPWRPHDALCNYQFLLQAICYGGLAGISYSLPAFQATAFTDCMHPSLHFVSTHSMWVNFAFITSGVVVGLVAGATVSEYARSHQPPPTILCLFLILGLILSLTLALSPPSRVAGPTNRSPSASSPSPPPSPSPSSSLSPALPSLLPLATAQPSSSSSPSPSPSPAARLSASSLSVTSPP
jgi:hypothetical protein